VRKLFVGIEKKGEAWGPVGAKEKKIVIGGDEGGHEGSRTETKGGGVYPENRRQIRKRGKTAAMKQWQGTVGRNKSGKNR